MIPRAADAVKKAISPAERRRTRPNGRGQERRHEHIVARGAHQRGVKGLAEARVDDRHLDALAGEEGSGGHGLVDGGAIRHDGGVGTLAAHEGFAELDGVTLHVGPNAVRLEVEAKAVSSWVPTQNT
jgi:hypothetical protein